MVSIAMLRIAASAVYLAVPEHVAKDISKYLCEAADEIEELRKEKRKENEYEKDCVHWLEACEARRGGRDTSITCPISCNYCKNEFAEIIYKIYKNQGN